MQQVCGTLDIIQQQLVLLLSRGMLTASCVAMPAPVPPHAILKTTVTSYTPVVPWVPLPGTQPATASPMNREDFISMASQPLPEVHSTTDSTH